MVQGKKCAGPGGITNDYCRTSLVAGTGTYSLGVYTFTDINIIVNGIDWTDGNLDGLADNWSSLGINPPIYSIVTGNGFSGTAQRSYNSTNLNTLIRKNITLKAGAKYRLSFKYRSNNGVQVYIYDGVSGKNITSSLINIGNAQNYSVDFLVSGSAADIRFYTRSSGGDAVIGDWVELDDVALVELSPLDTIVSGTEYLQNIVAGAISIPSTQAYGTWEWDIYKGGFTNPFIYFVNSNSTISANNGYDFEIHSLGGWYFHEVSNGARTAKIYNVNSVFSNYNWYRIKIVRTTAGQFTIYVKGGSFGDNYVTLPASSTSFPITANNFTTSNYFVFDIDYSDKVSNVSLNGQPVYPSLP